MSEENYSLIGSRLREERDQHQLAQDQLSEICGVTRRTVVAWERGEAYPNAMALNRAAAAGFDVLYVIAGVRSTPPTADALRIDQLHLLKAYERLREPARPTLITFLTQLGDKP